MFRESTSEEFNLRRNASHFSKLSDEISSKMGGSLRRILSATITDKSDGKIEKISASQYISTLSEDFRFKIGFKTGDKDFFAFGVTNEFIKKCAYKWCGGRNSSFEQAKTSSIVEESFISVLFSACHNNLEQALRSFGDESISVGYIDDKELALGKGTDILYSKLIFSFEEYEATLYLMGTTNIVASLQVEHQEKDNDSFKNLLSSEIKQELIVEFGQLELTPSELKNLAVGQKFRLKCDGLVDVKAIGSSKPICQGELGYNDKDERVVKI